LLLVVFGYAQFHAALPLYLSRPHGLAPSMVAAAVLANTCCVALAALPAGRLASRVPPQRLIGMGAVGFAAAWLILSQSRDGSWTSVGIAVAATITLGLGEVLLAAAIGPLVNALSPAELRGRYNALNALVLSLGTIIGPGLVATIFHGATTDGLFLVLIGGCLTAALLTSARLTPHRIRA
jgi:MFS family permease